MSENDPLDSPDAPPGPLTAGQKKFMAVAGGLMAILLAAGVWYLFDIGAFSERPAYQQKWAYCDAGELCTAIPAPCGTWVAVGDKYLDDARAYYDHMITLVEETPQMECASAPQSDVQPKAYCLSGLCMTAQ